MNNRGFRIVDVFGVRPYTGNPLGVVVDSQGLSSDEMLEITRWLGFSETTFLSEPTDAAADYAVRIFTVSGELPFAGHPTLGTCHVWRTHMGSDAAEVVQECGAGLIPLRVEDGAYAFSAPSLVRDGDVDSSFMAEVVSVLGIDQSDVVSARWIDNGPGWVGVLLDSAESVLALEPDFGRRESHGNLAIGVAGFYPEGSDYAYEVRAFFSNDQNRMNEDPVTGSLNAALAQWLISDGTVEPPYVASQGARLGREGRVRITADAGAVWVGGTVFDVVSGVLPGSA